MIQRINCYQLKSIEELICLLNKINESPKEKMQLIIIDSLSSLASIIDSKAKFTPLMNELLRLFKEFNRKAVGVLVSVIVKSSLRIIVKIMMTLHLY